MVTIQTIMQTVFLQMSTNFLTTILKPITIIWLDSQTGRTT
jgi:hypothetical protein